MKEIISNIYISKNNFDKKCIQCKQYFGKILCPSCEKINVCGENYFKSGLMKCGIPTCQSENYMINCIYCRKLNIFKKAIKKISCIIFGII